MPQCRLPDGSVASVGGCPECNALGGGWFDDKTTGPFTVRKTL